MTTVDLLNTYPVPCYVGGSPFVGSGTFDVRDPHDNSKVIHKVSSITIADVPKVVEIAAKAAKTWKLTSVLERRAIFLKAASLLRERNVEYAGIEFAETTSSQGWSGFELNLAAESLEETAAAASTALQGEIAVTGQGQRAYIERAPFGVVFGMAPWNAPVVLGQRACTQPIMGGNTSILKTSEMSPRTQLMLAQIFADAGLPAGVLNIIHVAPEDAPAVTEAIIAHPAVGKINFTGSTRVGSIIASTAGKHLKPNVMELGGKAPSIICADADLKHAAQGVMFGGWFHSGQVCMATQTVIVHESIADRFLGLIKAHSPNVKASKNSQDAGTLRGLFTNASAKRVQTITEDALSKGATVAAGTAGFENNVVQPILLSNVTPEMQIYREEMFAPIFSLLTFKTEEEAITIANDHDFGLAAAVWTSDEAAGHRIARQIDAGMVHINGATIHDQAQMPHGGFKKSGYGRFNGKWGIQEFTQPKVITCNQPHPYPI
ncbi:aldehyde dehydrogenase [Meredithblackwellia eburnea MCA 4105]